MPGFFTATPASPALPAAAPADRDALLDVISHSMAAALRPRLLELQTAWQAAGLSPLELRECVTAALLDLMPTPGSPYAP